MHLGSWKIDDYLTFTAATHNASTGTQADADSLPTYRIYKDESATPVVTGTMAKLDDDDTVGLYSERIRLTSASGFERGKSYAVYVTATVDGVTGALIHTFQITTEATATASTTRVDITETGIAWTGEIYNFYPGETVTVYLTITDNGVAQDISSDTVTFTMKEKRSDADADAAIQKDADVASQGASGIAVLTLTSAETAGLTPGDYFCDVVWTGAAGTVRVAYDGPVQVLTRLSDA